MRQFQGKNNSFIISKTRDHSLFLEKIGKVLMQIKNPFRFARKDEYVFLLFT